MSQPVKELKALLGEPATIRGSVVSVDGDSLQIATAQGLKKFASTASVAVGDSVTITNGRVNVPASPTETYFV